MNRMHFNKNSSPVKGVAPWHNLTEAMQRKQDRTTLLAASSKLNALASPGQRKIFEILAEATTTMGRHTETYPEAEPAQQTEFLKRARRILDLEPKSYSPEQARQALTAMTPFWNYLEHTWTPTKDFKTNAQTMATHLKLAGGTTAGDDNALAELKEAIK